MSLHEITARRIDGSERDLSEFRGKVLLIVNTASKCGLTPHYAGLEKLYQTYKDRGLVVLGFPCNQFNGQEPGTNEEIAEFCATTYGVTFPMMDKVEVNGDGRHPLFVELTGVEDAGGEAGDVGWNFEKWLVGPDGAAVARFRSRTEPESPEIVGAIEDVLPGSAARPVHDPA